MADAQMYYVMTMPGIEGIAWSEIREKYPTAELVKQLRGLVLFTIAASPVALLDLRTTEDVFFAVRYIKGLGRSQDALRVLHSSALHSDLEGAIGQWRRIHQGKVPRTWRMVSQKEGTHEFRRIDAEEATADGLRKVMLAAGKIRAVEENADIECWLWLNGSIALIGVRLSTAKMRHRSYKQEHLPASLRPTIAAAMVRLAQPHDDDRVVDPLCGTGTILIERGLAGPAASLTGGDSNEEAISLARRNARSAGITADWQVWDAQALPLEENSVDCILTNLPFGKQVGDPELLETLYPALAREFARILAPSGRLFALTSETSRWEQALREAGWHIAKKQLVVVLGQVAYIIPARLAATPAVSPSNSSTRK